MFNLNILQRKECEGGKGGIRERKGIWQRTDIFQAKIAVPSPFPTFCFFPPSLSFLWNLLTALLADLIHSQEEGKEKDQEAERPWISTFFLHPLQDVPNRNPDNI